MENLNKFLDEINDLKQAKELLDEILSGYSVYDNTFNFDNTTKLPSAKLVKDLGYKKAQEAKHLWKTNSEELNEKIRSYLKFDDSE